MKRRTQTQTYADVTDTDTDVTDTDTDITDTDKDVTDTDIDSTDDEEVQNKLIKSFSLNQFIYRYIICFRNN